MRTSWQYNKKGERIKEMVGINSKCMIGKYAIITLILGVIFTAAIVLSSETTNADPIIADHIASAEFDEIPAEYVSQIHDNYHIYYGHTSHGSQIMSGLETLEVENASYDPPYFHEVSDDLGHNGDVSWEPDIRAYLDSNPECNMVMMSWCGGCSDNTEEGINIYLNTFNQLELDYPDVTFVYMTGHLDGTGVNGNLYARNNQIRAYCNSNEKVLFDFADIESWDPDGNYYPDDTDYCNWCIEWCNSHPCPSCSCAHSQCFNCYLKGKAWWWMMARVSGWNETGGNDNIPPIVTITKPEKALYFFNKKIIPLVTTIVIGIIEVEVEASDSHSGVSHVDFYLDGDLMVNVSVLPFFWLWNEKSFSKHTLEVTAFDGAGNFASDKITLVKLL